MWETKENVKQKEEEEDKRRKRWLDVYFISLWSKKKNVWMLWSRKNATKRFVFFMGITESEVIIIFKKCEIRIKNCKNSI